MVDDEEADGGVGGFEFQAELRIEGLVEVGDVVAGGVIAGWVVHPGESEVIESGQAGLIDDGARGRGETGHGGDRGRKESEGDGSATVVLAGCGGWNVRDDAAGGREISDGE